MGGSRRGSTERPGRRLLTDTIRDSPISADFCQHDKACCDNLKEEEPSNIIR